MKTGLVIFEERTSRIFVNRPSFTSNITFVYRLVCNYAFLTVAPLIVVVILLYLGNCCCLMSVKLIVKF